MATSMKRSQIFGVIIILIIINVMDFESAVTFFGTILCLAFMVVAGLYHLLQLRIEFGWIPPDTTFPIRVIFSDFVSTIFRSSPHLFHRSTSSLAGSFSYFRNSKMTSTIEIRSLIPVSIVERESPFASASANSNNGEAIITKSVPTRPINRPAYTLSRSTASSTFKCSNTHGNIIPSEGT